MKNKEVIGLVAAALLMLAVAYTLSRSSAEADGRVDAGASASTRQRAPVVFPRDKPNVGSGALANDRAPPAPESQARLDTMQRVLLGGGKQTAVFIEANAIRHSPLMEKILACRAADAAADLDMLKRELGIDPMEDLDRIGFDGDVFVASGFFKDLKLPPDVGEGTPYGDGARLWTENAGKEEQVVFARLGDGMILSASDEAKVKAAIDRAEGRAGGGAVTVPPGFGQGEVYGTVGPDFIQGLLADSNDPTVRDVAKLVSSSTVRMLVEEDAALSLDLTSPDARSSGDLGAMIEAGLTLVRAEAARDGDADLAALLEQARVVRGDDGRINLDLAVPGPMLLKGMGCAPDGTVLPTPAGPQAPARPADGASTGAEGQPPSP